MRILHLSDTHLGIRRAVWGAPAGWQRADDHLEALRAALAPALAGDVDLVIHSGDMFDRSRPPQRAVVAGAQLLCDAARRVSVVVMPGNHDRRGLRRYVPHRIAGLHVLDAATQVDIAGVRLGCVPFRRTAAAWAADASRVCAGGVDLLVAHQAFHGARVPPGFTFRAGVQGDTVGEAHIPAGVRRVLCGHIHPRQVVEVGAATVVHCGSTERTAWSERHQTKGTVLWTAGRTWGWKHVDLPSRPLVEVAHAADLAQIQPGAIVRAPADLHDAVRRHGGWLDGPGVTGRRAPAVRRRPPPGLFTAS